MSSDTSSAILIGLGLGIALGLLKTWLLWYRANPFKPKKPGKEPSAQSIVSRTILGYFFNVIILGFVYLVRPLLVLPLAPLILAAATGLIACSLIYPLHNIFRK